MELDKIKSIENLNTYFSERHNIDYNTINPTLIPLFYNDELLKDNIVGILKSIKEHQQHFSDFVKNDLLNIFMFNKFSFLIDKLFTTDLFSKQHKKEAYEILIKDFDFTADTFIGFAAEMFDDVDAKKLIDYTDNTYDHFNLSLETLKDLSNNVYINIYTYIYDITTGSKNNKFKKVLEFTEDFSSLYKIPHLPQFFLKEVINDLKKDAILSRVENSDYDGILNLIKDNKQYIADFAAAIYNNSNWEVFKDFLEKLHENNIEIDLKKILNIPNQISLLLKFSSAYDAYEEFIKLYRIETTIFCKASKDEYIKNFEEIEKLLNIIKWLQDNEHELDINKDAYNAIFIKICTLLPHTSEDSLIVLKEIVNLNISFEEYTKYFHKFNIIDVVKIYNKIENLDIKVFYAGHSIEIKYILLNELIKYIGDEHLESDISELINIFKQYHDYIAHDNNELENFIDNLCNKCTEIKELKSFKVYIDFLSEDLKIDLTKVFKEDLILKLMLNNLNYCQSIIEHYGLKIEWSKIITKFIDSYVSKPTINIITLQYIINKINNIELPNVKSESGLNLPMLILNLIEQKHEVQTKNLTKVFWNLLSIKDSQDLPVFNVNFRNAENVSLIDVIKNIYHNNNNTFKHNYLIKIINQLRILGSEEPINSIKLITNIMFDKIDTTDGKLDGHIPNIENVTKILPVMYDLFPLTQEQQQSEIDEFVKKGYADYPSIDPDVTAWSTEKILTINEVIVELSKLNEVDDRLPIKWDFRAVLATIIHIARINEDKILNEKLLHCISELKMCELGKLLNLIHVVQDSVIKKLVENNAEVNIDYSHMQFEDFNPFLEEFIEAVDKDETLKKYFINWHYDYKAKTSPDKWLPGSTIIQGEFNKLFMKFISEKYNISFLDSHHFKEGLYQIIFNELNYKLNSKSDDEIVQSFLRIYQEGLNNIAKDLFAEIENSSIEQMENLIDNIFDNAKYNLGNFKNLDVNIIANFYEKICLQDADKAKVLIKLVKNNLIIGDDAEKFIDLHILKIQENDVVVIGDDLPSEIINELIGDNHDASE